MAALQYQLPGGGTTTSLDEWNKALGRTPGSQPNYGGGTTGGFNLSPAPTSGQGAYGKVPGQLGLPDPAGDLASVYPNLSGTNEEVSNAILRQLRGELSPETVANIQDSAASFGVASGMPGSGLATSRGLRDIGLATEQVQQQGVQNYQSVLPTVSGTQTVSPAQQSEIALQNAINAAAPDPQAAAQQTQALFNDYLKQIAKMSQPAPELTGVEKSLQAEQALKNAGYTRDPRTGGWRRPGSF